jgi:inner membrane protein
MTWSTHTLLGISSLWLLTLVPGHDPSSLGVLSAVAALGSLLPDLDAAESKIKHVRISGIKPFLLSAAAIHRTLGHRGVLHSLAGLVLFCLAALPLISWLGWEPWAAVVLGYASHLAADACTRIGIRLLYPKQRHYHLLPRPCRLVTGSQAEEVIFALAAISTALLLLSSLPWR